MDLDPEPLRLDDPRLFDGYDSRSVSRGVAYAAEGRVRIVDVEPGWAAGEVQGTASDPYIVDVEWAEGPGGTRVSDTCSCPLGGRCKHAVALIIQLTRQGDRRESATGLRGRRDPYLDDQFVSHASRSQAAAPRWRTLLAPLLEAEQGDASPLALQFTLHHPRTHYRDDLPTEVMVRPLRLGKRGKWVKTGAGWRELSAEYGWGVNPVDPEHLVVLRSLAVSPSLTYSTNNGPIPLGRLGPGVWQALRRAQEVGIAFVDVRNREVVQLAGDPASVAVDLRATDDGGVVVTAGFTRGGDTLVPGEGVGTIGNPAHGLFVDHGVGLELVPLDRPIHPGVAQLLRSETMVVPAPDVDELIDDYAPHLARIAVLGSSDRSVAIEAPHLDCLVAHVEHHTVDAARLHWSARYKRGERVSDHPLSHPFGAGRDRIAEGALVDELELPTDLLASLEFAGRPADIAVSGHDAVVLLTEVVPWLVERGQVAVDVTGEAPRLREAEGDPLIALDVTDAESSEDSEDPSTDWFDLTVEVTVDGERIPFTELLRALTFEEPVIVLASGTFVRLDRPELDRLRELIEEARGLAEPGAGGTARVNRFQSSWWEELAALGVVENQSRRWADAVARMGSLGAPAPTEPPVALMAELRHYQQEGLDWLAFLHRNRLGGILADDMGLGKTVQALALFLHVLDGNPDARFLVVAPTSVVENWHREADRFAPGVPTVPVSETEARRGYDLATAVGDARIVVTSYTLLRLEFEAYQELGWEVVVLDEAQFVKNHRSKTYHCVRSLDATMKLAVTGTPLENSLMDLWSLLSITAPGLYPDPQRFSEVYRKPIESGRAPELLATLRRRIAPLMRRRTKDEVLTELPPKTEQTVDVELSARHMRIYQSQLQRQRQKVLGLVEDVDRHRFEILRSLTILRQLSLDPALVDDEHEGVGSAKLDRLVEDLTQVIAEGHRALVFSQFTSYLSRVKDRLDAAGIDYAYLDGRTRKRDEAISRFTDGDVPVFVISLKAGGFGLNLTEADYCFVLDPWWNPAAETQAVDRTHRIGQRNAVMVYRYVSVGTIEEKVMELKARKSALFDSVIDADGALAGSLSDDDIRALIDITD